MKKLLALVAVALATVLTLAACGGGEQTSSGGTAQPFNDVDVKFAQEMIPHHRQAIEMAKLAAERAASPQVKELAADIERAQDPEITIMTGWLDAWGKDVPEDMGGMGHGGTEMPGMMSDEAMQALGQGSGGEFDRMFLQMMIKHHEGAIEMARTEQANGENPDAIELAKQIEAAQTAEIDTMKQLLGS